MKIVKLILLSITLCIGLILWLLENAEPKTSVVTFCAYGRTFIEFTEDNKRWGTILLDDDGRPVSCSEDTMKEPTRSNRSII